MRRRHGGTGLHSPSTCGNEVMDRCRELFPRCASCGNAGSVQAVALRLKINPNLGLGLFQTPCQSTRGAPKKRHVVPLVVIIVFIPHVANLLRSSSSFLLSLSPCLPVMLLPVSLRHIILTVKTVYPPSGRPSLRCLTISFPQLADTASIANITSNRLHTSIKPRDKSSCAICAYLSVWLPVLVAPTLFCFFL